MISKSKYSTVFGLLLVAPFLLFAACSGSDGDPAGPPDPDPPPEPQTGFVQISTTTAGADLDPDGYTVTMAGNSDRSIGLNGVTTFSDIAAGQHQVEISGLAGNCSVTGDNPVTVTVRSGATAQSAFDVVCVATTGSLEISTSTTNNFDPDGYRLLVDGVSVGGVEVNGSAQVSGVGAGNHSVELTHLAPNCETAGDNPRSVTVEVGQATNIDFAIECLSPPDGRLAFESYRGGRVDVYVMNTDGNGLLQLSTDAASVYNNQPRWSPDGKYVAFLSDEPGGAGSRLSVMRMDGSDLFHVTSPGMAADDSSPVWSPDGTQIAFTRSSDSGFDIYTVNLDGSGLAQLTADPAWDAFPAWSPDGSRIAFASDRGGDPCDLYVQQVQTGDVTRLTDTPTACEQEAAWSPDGSQITFRTADENGDTVQIINADGTGRVQIATDGGWPRWSPDGTRIVFGCEGAPGDTDICIVNADGSGRVNITNTPATIEEAPDWGP